MLEEHTYTPQPGDDTALHIGKWINPETMIRVVTQALHRMSISTGADWGPLWNNDIGTEPTYSEERDDGFNAPFVTSPKASVYYGILYPNSYQPAESLTNPAAKTWSAITFDKQDHSKKIAKAKATDIAMTLMQFSATRKAKENMTANPLVEVRMMRRDCTVGISKDGTTFHRLEWNDMDYNTNGRWTTVAGYVHSSQMTSVESMKSLSTKIRTNKSNIEANNNNMSVMRKDCEALDAKTTKEFDDVKTIANRNKTATFQAIATVTDNLNALKKTVDDANDHSAIVQELDRLRNVLSTTNTKLTTIGTNVQTVMTQTQRLTAGHDDHDVKLTQMNQRVNKLERDANGASIWDVITTTTSTAANAAIVARNAKAIADDTKDTTLKDIKDVSNAIKNATATVENLTRTVNNITSVQNNIKTRLSTLDKEIPDIKHTIETMTTTFDEKGIQTAVQTIRRTIEQEMEDLPKIGLMFNGEEI